MTKVIIDANGAVEGRLTRLDVDESAVKTSKGPIANVTSL